MVPKLFKTHGWLACSLMFFTLLIPSARFAWHNRDMPELADLHDDGILFETAKSLGVGHGYHIPSLPGNPFQTKYPPLYPLLLSIVWRINPSFPENLPLATLVSWLTLAVFLALSLRLYQREPALRPQAWWLMAGLSVCPYIVLFGSRLFTEIPFTCFVLIALLCVSRPGIVPIVAASAAAAAAYLTRTAGVALVLVILFRLALRRDWKRAGIFASITVPAILGWTLWMKAHLVPMADLSIMYYLDYMGFQAVNVGWDNIGVVLWKNVDQILYGMGALVLPKMIDLLPVKILTQVIGVAMLSGVVRLAHRRILVDYALFSLVSMAMLAVWHYPPNERFVLPLYPLLLAGLFTEMQHLWEMLRTSIRGKNWGDRIVAAGFGTVTAGVLLAGFGLQFFVTFFFMETTTEEKRIKLADRQAAYSWMKSNLPKEARVFSYDDPLLYLYTGHTGSLNPMLPRYWYAEDHDRIVASYRDLQAFCENHGFSYVYFTQEDGLREVSSEDRKTIETLVRTNPALDPVFATGFGTVYRVLPNALPVRAERIDTSVANTY